MMVAFPPDIEHVVDQIYPLARQHLATELARASRSLYWIDIVLQLAALALVYFSGAAARVRTALARRIQQPFLLTAAYVALFVVALAIVMLPATYYGSFVLTHRYGLSDESLSRWSRDWAVGVAVEACIAAVVGAMLMRAIARFRSWPLIAALLAGPLIFFGSAVYPLWIAPLFNDYTPLPPSPLTRSILKLARQQGLNASVVYQYDMSTQTREANAYVAGLGKTERIAVGDTLLKGLKPDEVLYVMAHEIGHYKLGHLWLGSFEGWAGAIVAIVWLWAAGNLVVRRFPRYAHSLSDPASAPLIAALVLIFQVVTAPVANALSRNIEQAADVFAADHTQLEDAGIRTFARLANQDLGVLHPSRGTVWYFYTHPPTDERILFAAQHQR